MRTLQSLFQKGREEFDKLIQPYQEHCCDSYRHSREDADKCKKMHGYCGYELAHGFDLSDIQSLHDEQKNLLAHHQSEILEAVVGLAEGMKMRFRCGACDGAKCEHTQCCQALSDFITELNKVKENI